MHVLLIRSGEKVFGIPSRMLRQALFADSEELLLGDDGSWRYELDEESYTVVPFERLVGDPDAQFVPGERRLLSMLLVEGDHGATAVVVEEAVDGRYLVVQRLGDFVPRVRAVIGASILQDGSVAAIVDLGELIRRPSEASVHGLLQAGFVPETPEAPLVLIVDDSLSARRSMSEIIGDEGYRVKTAVDGLDAIEVIADEVPDLVVLDLEMPNMNGLELAAHLRANNPTMDLPLLMVTSRSTAKHHEQASAVGVDSVITKPWQDEDLVEAVNVLAALGRA